MLYNRVRTARSRKRAADRTRALRDHARTLTNGIRRGREGSGSEEAGGEGGGEGGGGDEGGGGSEGGAGGERGGGAAHELQLPRSTSGSGL